MEVESDDKPGRSLAAKAALALYRLGLGRVRSWRSVQTRRQFELDLRS